MPDLEGRIGTLPSGGMKRPSEGGCCSLRMMVFAGCIVLGLMIFVYVMFGMEGKINLDDDAAAGDLDWSKKVAPGPKGKDFAFGSALKDPSFNSKTGFGDQVKMPGQTKMSSQGMNKGFQKKPVFGDSFGKPDGVVGKKASFGNPSLAGSQGSPLSSAPEKLSMKPTLDIAKKQGNLGLQDPFMKPSMKPTLDIAKKQGNMGLQDPFDTKPSSPESSSPFNPATTSKDMLTQKYGTSDAKKNQLNLTDGPLGSQGKRSKNNLKLDSNPFGNTKKEIPAQKPALSLDTKPKTDMDFPIANQGTSKKTVGGEIAATKPDGPSLSPASQTGSKFGKTKDKIEISKPISLDSFSTKKGKKTSKSSFKLEGSGKKKFEKNSQKDHDGILSASKKKNKSAKKIEKDSMEVVDERKKPNKSLQIDSNPVLDSKKPKSVDAPLKLSNNKKGSKKAKNVDAPLKLSINKKDSKKKKDLDDPLSPPQESLIAPGNSLTQDPLSKPANKQKDLTKPQTPNAASPSKSKSDTKPSAFMEAKYGSKMAKIQKQQSKSKKKNKKTLSSTKKPISTPSFSIPADPEDPAAPPSITKHLKQRYEKRMAATDPSAEDPAANTLKKLDKALAQLREDNEDDEVTIKTKSLLNKLKKIKKKREKEQIKPRNEIHAMDDKPTKGLDEELQGFFGDN